MTGVPARSPVASAAAVGHDARDLGTLEGRWQPGRVDPQRLDDLPRPVTGREIEQDRARAVGLVERVLAGQPEPHVVLGQQHVGDARPDLGFVVPDPDELRRGEAGQGVVAGDRR